MSEKLKLQWDGWSAKVGPLDLKIFDGANGGGWSVWFRKVNIAIEYNPGSELNAKLAAETAAWKWLTKSLTEGLAAFYTPVPSPISNIQLDELGNEGGKVDC